MILSWILYLILVFWMCFTVGFCIGHKTNVNATGFKRIKPILEAIGFIWCLPNTMIGVLLLYVAGGPKNSERYGTIRFRFQPKNMWYFPKKYAAMSWGVINTFRDWPPLEIVKIHEDGHSWQGLILGPLQPIFYALLSFLAAILYGKIYKANWLEMGARDVAGEKVDCIEDQKE